MIKFTIPGSGTSKPLIGLGITDDNVNHLTTGEPIMVNGDDIGMPMNILILHGRTTTDLMEALRKSGLRVTADTITHDCCNDPACPDRKAARRSGKDGN